MAKTDNIQIIEIQDNLGRKHRAGYLPVTVNVTATPNGSIVEPVKPAWVKQLEYAKINKHNYRVALELLAQDIVSHFAVTQADRVEAYVAPLRVSDTVAPGFFWIDGNGLITVNERWAKDRALDSDGDNAFLVYTKDERAAYFVKYPLTQVVPLLYRQTEKTPDTWGDYDPSLERWEDPRPLTEREIYDGFIKVHAAGEIGPKTNRWDALELYEAKQARMNYYQTACHLLSDIGRFYDLEGDLKKSRAGLGAKVVDNVRTIGKRKKYIIEDQGRWRVKGKVSNIDTNTLINIILRANLPKESYYEDTLGNIPFRELGSPRPMKAKKAVTPPTYEQKDHLRRSFTERLERLGVLKWTPIEHHDPAMHDCLTLEVFYRKGPKDPSPRRVMIQDERRDGGMHQQWFLPPVAVLTEGRVVWVSAREMLEAELAHIPTKQKRKDLWPQTHGQIEERPERAAQLQQAIQRFVNKYGLPTIESNDFKTMGQHMGSRMFTVVYGTNMPEKMWELVQPLRQWFAVTRKKWVDHQIKALPGEIEALNQELAVSYQAITALAPETQALPEGQQTVQAHNEKHALMEAKRKLLQRCVSCPDCAPSLMGGVKGSDKPYRRYLIAHPETLVPLIVPHHRMQSLNRCSAKRVGELHSQIAQSIPFGWTSEHNIENGAVKPKDQWTLKRAKVFIFGGDGTMGQLYAFPSGQRLQQVDSLFLPQVCAAPDEDYGVVTPRTYCSLSGVEKVAFTSEARPTIAVGKVISMYGMKNYCGVESEQLYAFVPGKGNLAVDFAINQRELMSGTIIDEEGREWKGKQCLEAMLEAGSAVTASVTWNGRKVVGRLVTVTLMRTTTPSENTRPEHRTRVVKAIAKHALRAAMLEPVARMGTIETDRWLNWDDRAPIGKDPTTPRLKPRDLDYLINLQHAAKVIGSLCGRCSAPQPSPVVEDWLLCIESEANEQ